MSRIGDGSFRIVNAAHERCNGRSRFRARVRALSAGAPGGREIPRAVLRAWDEAEARLFPTIMARPDLYQQSVSMIQRLLGRLRETCLDLPSLLAAHERGGDLVD